MINRLAQSLSMAVQMKTVSHADPEKEDRAAFQGFLDFLKERYPKMHEELQVEYFGESPLFTWRGKEEEGDLYLAHYDVVPTDGQKWSQDPFSGAVEDGFVFGRGTLDDKGSCILICEAIEFLIEEGFEPQKTIYFAVGSDEEVGGKRGAVKMAAHLVAIGAKIRSVIDEGGAVSVDAIDGAKKPFALIGLAEKGITNLELTLRGDGGHSSMPPKSTTIGKMASMIKKIENNPMKPRLTPTVQGMFETMAPFMDARGKLLEKIQPLFPIARSVLTASPTTNALLRTTFSVTMIEGGNAPNVLPSHVKTTVNARILQGDSVEGVVKYVQKLLGKEVDVKVVLRGEPTKVTAHDTAEFALLKEEIERVFGDVVVVPYLLSGGTDARHYQALSEHIFRFSPAIMTKADIGSVHSVDERISLENLEKGFEFYSNYMKKRSQS